MTKHIRTCDKPFPRYCSDCGQVEVQPVAIPYDAEIKHDGRLHKLHIPSLHVNKCAACGEIVFGNVADDEISQALREHLELLSPQEIREQLQRLGLTQKDFSERIHIAAETVSRWLSGAYIQSRAYDKLMRLFFEREALKHQTPETTGVIISDGELSPWHYSMPYQFAPVNAEILPEDRTALTAESDLTLAA